MDRHINNLNLCLLYANRQMDKHVDIQMDKLMDIQMDKHKDIQMDKHMDKQMDRQMDKRMDIHINMLKLVFAVGKQTDGQPHRQT